MPGACWPNGITVLDTAHAAGPVGRRAAARPVPAWEAMRPGDYARGGAGLTILWGWFDSPFGPALVMGTDRGICGIGFAAETGAEAAMEDLVGRWPKATLRRGPDARCAPGSLRPSAATADDAAAPDRRAVPDQGLGGAAGDPHGPCHHLFRIAGAIGHPQAVRAVGTAVGRNPISLLIPCHRALRKIGRAWRLSLGPAAQARDAGLGGGAHRSCDARKPADGSAGPVRRAGKLGISCATSPQRATVKRREQR